MEPQKSHKSFIFNQQIDSHFIFSMYEDDYAYIEEIFGITLAQLLPDMEDIAQCHQQADLPALKKAVHKIKPSFGFVGMLASQELCKKFEDLCNPETEKVALERSYNELWNNLMDSKVVITEEYQRIQEFNSANP